MCFDHILETYKEKVTHVGVMGVADLRVPLSLNVKQVKPDKSKMLQKGQIIASF